MKLTKEELDELDMLGLAFNRMYSHRKSCEVSGFFILTPTGTVTVVVTKKSEKEWKISGSSALRDTTATSISHALAMIKMEGLCKVS